MGDYATFLFARPSPLEGVARLIDVGNTLTQFNSAVDGKQADAIATRLDWEAVGAELFEAAALFDQEFREQSEETEQR